MGCRRGLENCFEVTTCGNKIECSNCTFKECEHLAEIKNSVAFAFHVTGITQCKMCDSNELVRRTDKNNFLNRSNTLKTSLDLDGYNIREKNDRLNFNVSGYQVVKDNEDNKTTPTTLPYITYSLGERIYNKTSYKNNFTFYNIFRELATDDHSQKQQKILRHGRGVILK